jgi:hypothetical protein
MSLLRCVALAAMMGCAARAGGGVFIPPDDEDAGSTTGPDVVNPATDTGGATACTPPEFNCNGRCANLLTDSANCGMCGRACPGGSACSAGTCVTSPACQAPRMTCGGACVDVTTSTAHCGACGNACASGQSCVGGACMGGGGCPAGQTSCSGTCVDTRTSAQNCGLCGIACAAGQTCSNGACVGGQACIAPRMMCGADCVDVLSSTRHCGFCNRACAAGQTCNSGTCTGGGGGCTAPSISCGGVCVNPLNNAQNCGSCLNACGVGQSCANGVCSGGSGTLDYRTVNTGRRCTSDTECSPGQTCITTAQGRICTTGEGCQQSTRTDEESQCGGRGSTCLLYGSTSTQRLDICVRGCVATATSEQLGACPTGFVCTTSWLRQPTGSTEALPGCLPHCTTDAHCAGVVLGDAGAMRCNTRTGQCVNTAPSSSLAADGAPCNPQLTGVAQCRGICFSLSASMPTQGLCGSFINLRTTQECPDNVAGSMDPRVPQGDNLAVCIFRNCARNAECGSGLVCTYPEDTTGQVRRDLPSSCGYRTTAQPSGIP